jgi:hypothetical protein
MWQEAREAIRWFLPVRIAFGRVSAMIPRGDIFHRNIFGNKKFI